MSEDRPLASASRRLTKKEKGELFSPDVALGLRAAGVKSTHIAGAMGVSRREVTHQIALAGGQEQIQAIREKLKLSKMEKLNKIEGKLYDRIEVAVGARDGEGKWKGAGAKSIDALFRAAHASEKIQQAVTGETQKVEVSGSVATDPVVDIKVMINALLGKG